MNRVDWVATTLLGLVVVMAAPGVARAYQVEADSVGNSIYVLLRNMHPTAVFSSVSLGSGIPSFVPQATASIVPSSVPASGSALAALTFDVAAGTPLGSTGDLELTVSGTAAGNPVTVVLLVPLAVVAVAPEAQGVVGVGVPTPDVGGVDSDGDGVSDAHEIAFGSDPFDSSSLPGSASAVPSLEAFGAAVLVLLLLLLGGRWQIVNQRSFGRGRR